MPPTCPTTTRDAVETYNSSKVAGATPAQLVLQTFDYILAACRRNDMMTAKKGVVELMAALNLDYLDVAGPLFRVYEYCLDIIREQKFDEAIGILSELRDAWATAIERAGSRVQTSSEETAQV